jgi:RNA polymerase sigma-70 factor (ECF subfamily)
VAGRSARPDESAFDALYRTAWPQAVRSAVRIVGDPGVAEEIAQEAFVRAFDRWRAVRAHPAPEAWVLRVTINLALDTVRRKAPDFVAPEPVHIDEMVVNSVVLRDALARLSRKQRAALVLRYFAGYQEVEIAAALNTSPGTVKTHLSRGTRRLRELLGGDDAVADTAPP